MLEFVWDLFAIGGLLATGWVSRGKLGSSKSTDLVIR